jgi:NAD-dependent deacetylase
MDSNPVSSLQKAVAILAQARRVLVLSGAGLSQASGIPTYRDIGGLWEVDGNLKFSNVESYRADPKPFAKFWAARRREIAKAKPNAAHRALKRLQRVKGTITLVTQNIDGLLQAAGCERVLELHGNLRIERCVGCNRVNGLTLRGRCLHCFAWTRPDVVLFGEPLPELTLNAANDAARLCDVIVVVGTSAVVYPAAQLPILALRNGARLIVIDTEPPLLAHAADAVLSGKAELLLPQLVGLALEGALQAT